MQSATNPLNQTERFLIEANNELGGELIADVIDDPPEEAPDATVQCIDVTDDGQALLVLESTNTDGLNHTVTADRDDVL